MLIFLSIALAIAIYFFVFPNASSRSTVLYEDKGRNTRILVDSVNQIKAKPDMIIGNKHTSILIEYKSRNGKVYPSDIAQAYAGVLAARGSGMKIHHAEVHTRTTKQTLPLSSDDKGIINFIEPALSNARLVVKGGIPQATPATYKCRSCNYKTRCPHAQY